MKPQLALFFKTECGYEHVSAPKQEERFYLSLLCIKITKRGSAKPTTDVGITWDRCSVLLEEFIVSEIYLKPLPL